MKLKQRASQILKNSKKKLIQMHFEDRVLNKRAAKVWTNLLKLIRGLLKNQT